MADETEICRQRILAQNAENVKAHFARNQINEIHRAEQLFARRQNSVDAIECACLCITITSMDEQPSEAVMAKAHAMLAVDGVGPSEQSTRL